MFELLFVMLNGKEVEEYRKAQNQENYIREYMNDNYDKFGNINHSAFYFYLLSKHFFTI